MYPPNIVPEGRWTLAGGETTGVRQTMVISPSVLKLSQACH